MSPTGLRIAIVFAFVTVGCAHPAERQQAVPERAEAARIVDEIVRDGTPEGQAAAARASPRVRDCSWEDEAPTAAQQAAKAKAGRTPAEEEREKRAAIIDSRMNALKGKPMDEVKQALCNTCSTMQYSEYQQERAGWWRCRCFLSGCVGGYDPVRIKFNDKGEVDSWFFDR